MTNEFNPDWLCVCGDLTALGIVHRKDGPCYIPEPKREWVGLTQQDIDIAFDDTQEGGGFDEFARAIEAKLKEKNSD
jgi:hypothetical protein